MFKAYDKKIRKILSDKSLDSNWKEILKHHQRMISLIQHERLIHLLVTIFVGLIMSIGAFITIITQTSTLLIFVAFLFILFTAYLFHYRFLENTTQNWYKIEEEIVSRL